MTKIEISKVLTQAIQAHRERNFAKANSLYQLILKADPYHPHANHNLGVLAVELEVFDEAKVLFKRAIEADRQNPQFWSSLIECLLGQNDSIQALECLYKALSYFKADRKLLELEKRFQDDISVIPTKNLSQISSGDLEVIMSLFTARKFNDALVQLRKHIFEKPFSKDLWNLMGAICYENINYGEALLHFKRAFKIAPGSADIAANIGSSYFRLADLYLAEEFLLKAINLNENHRVALNTLGNLKQRKGESRQAINYLEKCITLDPLDPAPLNNMGNCYAAIGDNRKAKECFQKAIKLKFDYVDAHRNLSSIVNYSLEEKHLNQLLELLDLNLTDIDKSQTHYSLFKAYSDLGDYKVSYDHLLLGNKLRFDHLAKSGIALIEDFSKIKNYFHYTTPSKTYTKISTRTHVAPIFVIGMMRAGTTLLERLISGHSKIYAHGEIEALNQICRPIVESRQTLSNEIIKESWERYYQWISLDHVKWSYFVDKMPINFAFVGFIKLLFPDAKIVHIHRNPKAVCWSNLHTYFSAHAHTHTYNIDYMLDFYEGYVDLMNFWEASYPKLIHHVSYEDLTSNLRPEIENIFEYLELDFQEACLFPEINNAPINTASVMQARKPVYTGSSDQWMAYKEFLPKRFLDFDPKFSFI